MGIEFKSNGWMAQKIKKRLPCLHDSGCPQNHQWPRRNMDVQIWHQCHSQSLLSNRRTKKARASFYLHLTMFCLLSFRITRIQSSSLLTESWGLSRLGIMKGQEKLYAILATPSKNFTLSFIFTCIGRWSFCSLSLGLSSFSILC